MSSDSESYSKWADILIELDFNFYRYYSQNTFINPNYIYTIPVLLIAILKLLFGSNWQYFFMLLNITLVFFSLIIFLKSLLILKVRPLVISLAMPILTLSIDLLTWPRYILTDVIFSFFVILTVYLIIKSFVDSKLNYFCLLLMIILIYFTRPTSLPFIVAIISFILISKVKIDYSPKLKLLFGGILFIISPFVLATIFQLMNIYFNDNAQVIFLIEMVEMGMIVHDRPETWVEAPKTFFDLAYLYFLRFIYFFNPYAESFSIIHVALNSIQTFILFFSIFVFLFFRENFYLMSKSIKLILLICFFVAYFHSFTLIDFDWRYRFPIILPLTMIFIISVEILLKKIEFKFNLNK